MDKLNLPNYRPGMMELSYQEICDINTSYRLIQDRNNLEPVLVHLHDMSIVLPRRRVIWYILFWGIFVNCNKPITSRYLFPLSGVMNTSMISKIQTFIYKELIHDEGITQDLLTTFIWEQINEMNRFIRVELAEYQETISMLDLAHIVEDPKIKELVRGDIPLVKGIPFIEKKIIHVEKELARLLGTKGELQNTSLYHMQRTGALNAGQVRQMFGPLGVKTDVNESVILHYIPHSVTYGMQSIFDFITESFSSRKAAFYTQGAIKQSQYFGRKQHLITSTVRTLHPGDCGTNVLVSSHLNIHDYISYEGKIIVEDGKFVTLTMNNLQQYIDKTVWMRSPITCRHTDGICKVCGGELAEYIPDRLDRGIVAATCVTGPTGQKILSTKHYSNTSSVVHNLHPSAMEFFTIENNSIYLRDDWVQESNKLMLGIPHKNIRSLQDLLHIDSKTDIRERIFSKISDLVIMDSENNEHKITMTTDETTPFLSKKALLFLKSRFDEITTDDDYIWIPLSGLKDMRRFAFMKMVVINDSMMLFVETITGFLAKNIAKYTSVSAALEDFSQLVYSKVQVNIMHLEILLKAYLISGVDNYDIPVVTDADNVMFAKMSNIISNRTISGELAFERHKKYLTNITTYMIPKNAGPLDKLIGI